jgi:hypothetical protein
MHRTKVLTNVHHVKARLNTQVKNFFERIVFDFDIQLDEGSAKCLPRPKCEAKHYRKIFTGCDTSNTVN